MKKDNNLYSGDISLIVQNSDKEEILEHFGENSFEYLAYEHYLADKMWERRKENKEYKLPEVTEDPRVHCGMLKRWITTFCQLNQLELPPGFHQKNAQQLRGMFNGMRGYYQFTVEELGQ